MSESAAYRPRRLTHNKSSLRQENNETLLMGLLSGEIGEAEVISATG